ncbi:MAG: hypothetical protein ACXVCN_19715 [Bdellovibrio sp.]
MTKIILLITFFISIQAQAGSLGENARSLRSRAMGGVYIPFANNAESIFFNPAGLGKSSLLDIKLLEVDVGVNTTAVTEASKLQKINPSDPASFNQLFGKRIWAEVTGKSAVSLPFISMGYLNDAEVSLDLHNPAFPEFETYFRNDQAFYLGSAFTIMPSTYLGAAVKRINRWGGSTENIGVSSIAGATSIDSVGANFQNKGQGYGIDLAILTELPAPILKPTFTVVWQDVGNTAFTKTAGVDAPVHINQNLSVGSGITVDLPLIDLAAGFEARHLMEPDIEIGKKLHLGAELSIPLIDLRAGYSQGYLSYGVGFNFLIFHFDAVSYTEEMGVYTGQEGDARYMASLSIDLSFDADFKFTDNNGKKRKLKQRR